MTVFEDIEAAVCAGLIGRDDEVHSVILSILGGFNMFMLGEPGTAKSFIVNSVLDCVDGADRFHLQMHAATSPDEVFGPPKISALRDDRLERAIDGFLPTARFAFLDEGFNASSAVLNALLEAMNERTFTNGTSRLTIPLSSVFVASNNVPPEVNGDLAALWDRLTFRHVVAPLSTAEDLRSLLDLPAIDAPRVDWAEVEAAQRDIADVVVPDEVKQAIIEIVVLLGGMAIHPTARRIRTLPRVVATEAFLRGGDTVQIDDLEVLRHVLWSDPADRKQVRETVESIASKVMLAFLQLEEAAKQVAKDCRAVKKASKAADKKDRLVKAQKRAERVLESAFPAARNADLRLRRRFGELIDQIDDDFASAYTDAMGYEPGELLSRRVRNSVG